MKYWILDYGNKTGESYQLYCGEFFNVQDMCKIVFETDSLEKAVCWLVEKSREPKAHCILQCTEPGFVYEDNGC